jgi:gluconate 2-dehydrogenase gamma chain
MNRREVVRLLAGAVAVPVLSGYGADELFALGPRVHNRAATAGHLLHLFNPHQRAAVAAIAERIIPETDTPGAGAAGVPDFIELIVAEHYKQDQRTNFLQGLADVDARSQARFGPGFAQMTPAQQDEILARLEAEVGPVLAQKPPEKQPVEPSQQPEEKPTEKPRQPRPDQVVEQPAPFWHQVKFLTLYGYYTSKIGVTQELRSVVIPGRYDPCIATGIPGPRGR